MNRILTLTAAAVLAATVVLAGPGDPFGGDDTGCVPDTADHLKCELKMARSLAKITRGTTGCHDKQAAAGFDGAGFGEPGCEQAVQAKFDKVLGKLGVAGICPQAVLDNAAAAAAILLADRTQTDPPSMDAFNGSFFCDSTSGALLSTVSGDNEDDDAGWIPATEEHLKCEAGVAKNVAKLWLGIVAKCHVKAAKYGFVDIAFDEEACEGVLRAKYDSAQGKLVALGICPPCLDATAQAALADEVEGRADQENGDTFVCP
jgi:hypothetical protein